MRVYLLLYVLIPLIGALIDFWPVEWTMKIKKVPPAAFDVMTTLTPAQADQLYIREHIEVWNEAIDAAYRAARGPLNRFSLSRNQIYWNGRDAAADAILKLKRKAA